jgi:hypothetical protein
MTQISTSSQQITTNGTRDAIHKEQETAMRDWMLSQIDTKHVNLFSRVNRPWDKGEVLAAFFDTIEIKDIIFIPEIYGRKNKIRYTPWYSILSIANMVGGQVGALRTKILKAFEFLTIEQLETKTKSLQIVMTETPMIVPSHLKDKNYKRRLFVNNQAILTFIRHIAHRSSPVMVHNKDVRPIASNLLTMMDQLDGAVTDIVDEMNDLVTEYKIKQLEADQKRLELYDKQKQALDNALQIAIERIKDVELSKKYHMYIFTTKAQEVHMKYKFGITDDLSKRLISLQNGDQTDGGKYVHQVEVYNNRWSERLLHQILKDVGLHCDGEWYMTPGEEPSIKLLDTLASSVNDTYDVAIEFPALIRNRLKEQLSIDYSPTPAIMPPPIMVVDEAKLVNDFIKDVANKVGADKPIYKTHLLKILRELANDDRYKKHKDKLPTDFDRFANTTDDGINTNGIKIETKSAGRQTTIRFIIEIITTD